MMGSAKVKMEELSNLTREMISKGYPGQNLEPDGKYHRFPMVKGGRGTPGYYLVKMTAAGYWAVYGDFVSGCKHFWVSDNGKQLSSEEAEQLKAKLADEA